jgi:hypothetical protein
MSLVVVERSFPEPLGAETLRGYEERGAGCLEVHGARFLYRYFSADRTRMTCLFEAPDAESVRLAQGSARIPFDRVWTARLVPHAVGEPECDVVFVERTLPEPTDEARIREAAARAAECLERQGCRILRSYLSVDGRRAACVFTGPDAESVRRSQCQARLPYDRAWPAIVYDVRPAEEREAAPAAPAAVR